MGPPDAPAKGRARRLRNGTRSEIEIVDVFLAVDEGRAEQDLAAIDDLQLAELAGLDLGRPGRELAVDDGARHMNRGIAEIDRVPQYHRLDAVRGDIGLHGVGRG